MLTFFSIPKPFSGHIGVIQRNALASWGRHAGCETLLLGNEAGTREAAEGAGATWLPDIALNDYGTPLLSSAFEQARRVARNRLLCYVNADIIVTRDLPRAAARVRFREFLMLGQRWDLELAEPLDFTDADWEARLRRRVAGQGTLHPPSGSDYFVFPKDSELATLPPFAVGRPAWDNWLIFRARQLGLAVVDASDAVMIVHQNHDYGHVKASRGHAWEGPEADRNRELAGGYEHVFTLLDVTHRMDGSGIRRALERRYLERRLATLEVLSPAVRRWLVAWRWMRGIVPRVVRALKRRLPWRAPPP